MSQVKHIAHGKSFRLIDTPPCQLPVHLWWRQQLQGMEIFKSMSAVRLVPEDLTT
jgi:hypothetical protein